MLTVIFIEYLLYVLCCEKGEIILIIVMILFVVVFGYVIKGYFVLLRRKLRVGEMKWRCLVV